MLEEFAVGLRDGLEAALIVGLVAAFPRLRVARAVRAVADPLLPVDGRTANG